ncbi:flagellar basal body P-ring formation protein FlgA [Rhizobium sp. TRM95111]|uniref:flagellar basal body P-ring formation chaperone FlgA n=1 Tax=Rhizobium alarense TaxID=2846851 RepID=UPI001F272C39|nr:flagellar basal body P-ring formation chaperone FlgA [Rhizobium alarense]MCF3639575.1 flagellar basal body P-ring formation protein FlgA [Rhizobium alarense]
MMFRRNATSRRRRMSSRLTGRMLMFSLAALVFAAPAFADSPLAVVPKRIIYPGEQLQAGLLEEVEVTNPNLRPGYARHIGEIDGLITRRTLLPGRIILVSALREPYAVNRGSSIKLVYEKGPLRISASGTPLQDAAIGELIRVRNKDTGVIVSGTVMADGTIHVVAR